MDTNNIYSFIPPKKLVYGLCYIWVGMTMFNKQNQKVNNSSTFNDTQLSIKCVMRVEFVYD